MKQSSIKGVSRKITALFVLLLLSLTSLLLIVEDKTTEINQATIIVSGMGEIIDDDSIDSKEFTIDELDAITEAESKEEEINPIKTNLFNIVIVLIVIMIIFIYIYLLKLLRRLTSDANKFDHILSKSLTSMEEFEEKYDFSDFSKIHYTINRGIKEFNNIKKNEQKIVNNIAHDIRTPLQIINIYNELTNNEYTEKVSENISLINAITNDILEIKEEKRKKISSTEENINILVKELINELTTTIYTPSMIKLVEEDELEWCVDITMFKRVLINLINNACVASGMVEIRITKTAIIVTNSTNGSSELENFFMNFEQNSCSSEKIKNGHGLGIIKELCAIQKIKIKVKSSKEQGAKFTLTMDKKIENA